MLKTQRRIEKLEQTVILNDLAARRGFKIGYVDENGQVCGTLVMWNGKEQWFDGIVSEERLKEIEW